LRRSRARRKNFKANTSSRVEAFIEAAEPGIPRNQACWFLTGR
jgi:hypothetical protein